MQRSQIVLFDHHVNISRYLTPGAEVIQRLLNLNLLVANCFMKNVSSFLLLFLLSFGVYADTSVAVEKPFSLGAGVYRNVIVFDESSVGDDELTGMALTFAYAVSDNFALRGTYFSLEHDDFSDIESTGLDLLAYFGTGLATQGFKVYGGGGFFKDKWELGPFSKTFDGLQLNAGLGYNWNAVSLDLVVGLRDSGDYEEFVDSELAINSSATAVSSSLLLAFRF